MKLANLRVSKLKNYSYSKLTLKLISIFSIGFLLSCNNDHDNDGVPDKIDICPNTPIDTKVNAEGCPEIEKKISKVVFYFDASESNAGYYYGSSKFNAVITAKMISCCCSRLPIFSK